MLMARRPSTNVRIITEGYFPCVSYSYLKTHTRMDYKCQILPGFKPHRSTLVNEDIFQITHICDRRYRPKVCQLWWG